MAESIQLPCPRCKQPTTSLKQFMLFEWFVFLYVYVWARRGTYTACPSCMRTIVAERFVYNLIPANLAMFFLGPFFVVQFLRTFIPGHSKEIQQGIEEWRRSQEAPRLAAAANARDVMTTLVSVKAMLDRRDYATALDELLAVPARLKRPADWDRHLDDYVSAIVSGQFDEAYSLITKFPVDLQLQLYTVVKTYAERPPEVVRS